MALRDGEGRPLMSDWLSTAELAALALPGLPATQRGWNEYAEREGWI